MKDFKTKQDLVAAGGKNRLRLKKDDWLSIIIFSDFAHVMHEALRQIILRKETVEQFDLFRRFELLFATDPKETKYKAFKKIVERICYEVEGSNQV